MKRSFHAAVRWLPVIWLTACAAVAPGAPAPMALLDAARLASLSGADAVLLGERHDAPDHQQLQREVIAALAVAGRLAGVAVEMAERGTTTAGLPRDADAAAIQAALRWDDKAWPWAAYGPAVTAAVRAGVPVRGANLPRDAMRGAMADARFDGLLPGPALKAQQQAIRIGHCGMLPEDRIGPMTRIQVARDDAMAQTVAELRAPGRTVVLLAGAGHVDRQLGVPQHLPRDLVAKAVKLQAGGDDTPPGAAYDAVWRTQALPESDPCAVFKPKS